MGIILVAIFVVGFAAVAVGGLVFLIGYRLRRPNVGAVAACLCVIVIVTLFISPAVRWIDTVSTVTKLDVSPESAPWISKDFELSTDSVEDFCCQRSGRSFTRADFKMSPENFLQWADSQGWTLDEFQADERDVTVYPLRNGGGKVGLEVQHSYLVEESDGISSLHIVYDIDEQRVYVVRGWL